MRRRSYPRDSRRGRDGSPSRPRVVRSGDGSLIRVLNPLHHLRTAGDSHPYQRDLRFALYDCRSRMKPSLRMNPTHPCSRTVLLGRSAFPARHSELAKNLQSFVCPAASACMKPRAATAGFPRALGIAGRARSGDIPVADPKPAEQHTLLERWQEGRAHPGKIGRCAHVFDGDRNVAAPWGRAPAHLCTNNHAEPVHGPQDDDRGRLALALGGTRPIPAAGHPRSAPLPCFPWTSLLRLLPSQCR